ncbi:MAG: peptidylprolyl isomerase [Erysipelothrix sp.]
MIDNLKKYWFVIVIGLVFIVGIGYYSSQQMNSVLKGKKVDGKHVVSEISGVNYLADDLYTDVVKQNGNGELYKLFEKEVISSVPTTDEAKEYGEKQAKALKSQFAETGSKGLKEVENYLKSMGYKDISELNIFFENMHKRDKLVFDFAGENEALYITPFLNQNKPRIVKHILVKMEDPANPTEAEQAKMDEVIASLNAGETFDKVASAKSDDTNSALQGGLVGYVDVTNTQLVAEFKDASLAAENGVVTDWVQTNFGRHLILVDTSIDSLKANDDFVAAFENANPTVGYKAVWKHAQTLDIKYKDDATKQSLLDFMGIKEGE